MGIHCHRALSHRQISAEWAWPCRGRCQARRLCVVAGLLCGCDGAALDERLYEMGYSARHGGMGENRRGDGIRQCHPGQGALSALLGEKFSAADILVGTTFKMF